MFSSRIIKSVVNDIGEVKGVCFERLGPEFEQVQQTHSEGFEPLFSQSIFGSVDSSVSGFQEVEGEQVCPNCNLTEDEVQKMVQEAYENGFCHGRTESESSFSAICRIFSENLSTISGLRQGIIHNSKEDLLKLSVLIAKQIIRKEVSVDRGILSMFVSEATNAIALQEEICISFNPAEFQQIAENRDFYLPGTNNKIQIDIKPDDSVSEGGCRIESPTGVVDAQIESQLSNIYNQLIQSAFLPAVIEPSS